MASPPPGDRLEDAAREAARLAAWQSEVITSAPADPTAQVVEEPLAALGEVFGDFPPTESEAARAAASAGSQDPSGPGSEPGDAGSEPGDAGSERAPEVGLHGEDAAAFLAAIEAAERSKRADWLPLVVIGVLLGLFVVAWSGVLQTLWAEYRQHEISRRLDRPRAGKSWSDRHRIRPQDLELQRASPEVLKNSPTHRGW